MNPRWLGRDENGVWWIHVWLVGPFVLVLVALALGVALIVEAVVS